MSKQQTDKQHQQQTAEYSLSFDPRAIAMFNMAMASSVHFAGYEFARSGLTAMFSSEKTGFTSSTVAPLAMGCVSPFSIGLLWIYTRTLRSFGPRAVIVGSTFASAAVLFMAGIALSVIDRCMDENSSSLLRNCSRSILFALFVIQNGFVQLLHTQHWSFLSSMQSGAVWFAPIAGLGSLASTAAAFAVSPLVDQVGLPGLLLWGSILLLVSAHFANDAYRVAQENGFEPSHKKNNNCVEPKKQQQHNDQQQTSPTFLEKAQALFRRRPVFVALCLEVLVYQCQSSLMNFLFYIKVKDSVINDNDRARWTGMCYAWINGSSGVLQFLILPMIIRYFKSKYLWLVMPGIILSCACWMFGRANETTLYSITASFSLMKVLEYSLRGAVTEMLYASLDYESRFVGKEIVALFASRFGKSGMAIALACVTACMEKNHYPSLISALTIMACLWLLVSYRLTNYITLDGGKKEKAA